MDDNGELPEGKDPLTGLSHGSVTKLLRSPSVLFAPRQLLTAFVLDISVMPSPYGGSEQGSAFVLSGLVGDRLGLGRIV